MLPEVGGYGSQAVSLCREGDTWQANFKLTPGLTPGWHEVRVRTRNSGWSNTRRIAVDLLPKADSLSITGICDGKTWTPGQVALDDHPVISIWISGLPENADRNNVRVDLSGIQLAVDYLSAHDPDKPRQVNAKLPAYVRLGSHAMTVAVGEIASPPVAVALVAGESPSR